ncbi:MAG: class I SAM-dependent methyltransferase [Planctomycetes bacterium]|nr:class I SAM-dependent methyltransferase [Planctomycetota bacterium]
MAIFKDHFSAHAALYAQARPTYPPELFAYLASLCPRRVLAWDVGTGNGQAAVMLAEHFDRVIATDASAEQISHAAAHPRIEYRVATAEAAALEPARVDLVAVAQALHWFNFDAFYANVRRVLAPGGLLAVWCYSLPHVDNAVDAVMMHLYRDITRPYWPKDRDHIESRYENVPFPFDEIKPTPLFACRMTWTLANYVNYLTSWSGTQRYMKAHNRDPLDLVRTDLAAAWGDPDTPRIVTSPIHMRIGHPIANCGTDY